MKDKTPKLIIVIPCYNEEKTLPVSHSLFLDRLDSMIKDALVSPESLILLVDDGSSDSTWQVISELAKSNPKFIGIRQSRNRGHQFALWAGLMEARVLGCDITITIDCDGQDDVHAMTDMVKDYANGSEVVYGVRNDRSSDTFFKRFTAESFYRLQAAMGVEVVFNHADYRLLSSKVLDALSQYHEVNLYLRGLIPLVGFKSSQVSYKREKRVAGEGHYGLFKMLAFAVDGITSLTVRPLHWILTCGILMTFLGFASLVAMMIVCLTGKCCSGVAVLSSVAVLVGGLNLIGMGLVGIYIGKAYLELKNRPRAIISERTWN